MTLEEAIQKASMLSNGARDEAVMACAVYIGAQLAPPEEKA